MISLEGKVAVVTGASRGIGRGIALAFARHGASVLVNYARSGDAAQQVVAEIQAIGGTAAAFAADVADRDQVEALFAYALDQFGPVDILVNNAGVAMDCPLDQMTDEAWARVLAVNLTGTFLCSQVAARQMRARGQGKIINVSAATALRGRRNGANFCAAKAGVIALTKCLALELAPDVQVNCLVPGFTRTEEVWTRFRLDDDQVRQALLATIPLGRLATVEDIAHGALFLASEMADYITGQLLFINGGSYM